MHEQSIVESIMALSLEHTKKANAGKIRRIYLVVGDLSGVVDESMNFYFRILSKNTLADQAELFFMHTPAQLRCRHCETVFEPQKLNFHCPQCQEEQVDIVSGRELYIESLDVE